MRAFFFQWDKDFKIMGEFFANHEDSLGKNGK